MLRPNEHHDGPKGEAFGRRLALMSPLNGICALMKEDPENVLDPSAM
jgi:hypothetical protein